MIQHDSRQQAPGPQATKPPTRPGVTTRIVRPGEVVPPDREWLDCTVAERIEAVWTLTKIGYAWNREEIGEPRLQRTVSRVQRSPS